MSTNQAERRRLRKELRLMQSQSAWLQKALFALHKAETVREKLADSRNSEESPWVLEHEGESYNMDSFEEVLEGRIQALLTETRERRMAMR